MFQLDKESNMCENDSFTARIQELLHFNEAKILDDGAVSAFAYSGSHEMMDDERLELPMCPSHGSVYLKMEEMNKVYLKQEEERVRMYGHDQRIMDMLCTETSYDLDRCMWRIKRGEDLQEQIRIMFELRDHGKYHEAKNVGMWLLAQNERYGVGYNKELLRILKQAVVALSNEVDLLDAS